MNLLTARRHFASEAKTILDIELKKIKKNKPLKPLVICGPPCSGKTALIENFIFKYPDVFKFIPPFTTKKKFERDQVQGLHYIKGKEEDMKELETDNQLFFLDQIDPPKLQEFGQFRAKTGIVEEKYFEWVRKKDVEEIYRNHDIAMIRCSLTIARKMKEAKLIECNYLACIPPSIETMTTRIIRHKVVSKEYLAALEVQQKSELNQLMSHQWADATVVSDKLDEFVKKASLTIVSKLYKMI